VLLANPRWERRFVRFLELSGTGRTVADGIDEDGARAARMDERMIWETRDVAAPRRAKLFCFLLFSYLFFVKGHFCPRDLRAAHVEDGGSHLLSS